MHFGEHLMIDGYGGDQKKLKDEKLIRSCLEELPKLLDMRILAPVQIVPVDDNRKNDPGGISGIVMIVESHISIHTFTERRFLTADVYSCKSGMDTAFVVRYFKKKFCLRDVEQNFVLRGTRYPQKNIS